MRGRIVNPYGKPNAQHWFGLGPAKNRKHLPPYWFTGSPFGTTQVWEGFPAGLSLLIRRTVTMTMMATMAMTMAVTMAVAMAVTTAGYCYCYCYGC